MPLIHVYPVDGLQTRDPVTKRLLPADGIDVDPNDLYWARRLADKTVTTDKPKASTSNAASATKAPGGGSTDA